MSKNVLITGASGFIGKFLNKKLHSFGNINVLCISRETGFDLSKKGWTESISNQNIDTIIHLAQSNFYRDFPNQVEDLVSINIDATVELLNWARKNKINKFIFASTGNVYEQANGPYKEDSKLGPNSFYGATKLAAEHLVNQYQDYFQVITLRLFGVYGPGQQDMLIPNIIRKINEQEEIGLAQGLGIMLTPIYIDDCIDIIIGLITEESEKIKNTVFNIAGSETVTLRDIIEIIEKILLVNAKIKITSGEIAQFVANKNKIDLIFGKTRYTCIEDGLKETIGK